MTRDDIIRIGLEAGLPAFAMPELIAPTSWKDIERFAQLVAEAEREACAKVVDDNAKACKENSLAQIILFTNATAIRARGQQ